jgi:hypothetical protein
VIDHNGSLLPSVYLWLPVLCIVALICLVFTGVAILASAIKDHNGRRDHDHWIVAWIPALALPGLIITSLFGYYPYGADYHRLQPATGVVKAVDSRFLAASQYVVVTYDTGLTVRCDDSRCATVRTGDRLRLLCTKEHQFGSPQGADGWACRWGEQ